MVVAWSHNCSANPPVHCPQVNTVRSLNTVAIVSAVSEVRRFKTETPH